MRKILILLLCFMPLTLLADETEVFQGLVKRILPLHADKIVGEQLKKDKHDYFTLHTENDKLIVGGNNANSMAVGLNHYLKYYCNTTVSWFVDDHFDAPQTLPAIETPVRINARCENRFFLNYCTFGYTMPWWDWRDWEHFIDWMALNGINLPLAITGQEAIWHRVWMRLGLKDEEIRHYFTGPAHLPWHRMLNIDYWQGDLPMSWLDDQEMLQKKIVERERAFNMRPVLPAFAGHVPQELHRVYPHAKITKLGAWSGYADEYACSFLDPMDPLFTKIQKLFLDEQRSIYGTDHVYGIDLFNELTPPSYEPTYLRRVSNQVYGTLKKADSKAVWLQMTWLFYNERKDWTNDRIKAYITAFPANRQILLDYYCEVKEVWQQTNKYYGVPYVWCYLGNFGGNTMLAGDIKEIDKRLENTIVNGGKNFTGLGSTLEGFDCNPFVYEYVFEKAWDFPAHHDIKAWTRHIADERTGKTDENAREAWDLLIQKIYCRGGRPGQCSVLNIRPSIDKFRTYYKNHKIYYDNKDLLKVAQLLLKADSHTTAYTFDVVNITRQLLSNYFGDLYFAYQKAYDTKNFVEMKRLESDMLTLLTDIDELVGTQNAFLMGKWIKDARKKGIDESEQKYYERNARNLLTTWGEKAKLLNDYASRTWNGLVSTYYAERWKMFFAAVNQAMLASEPFDEDHYKAYEKGVTEYEWLWWKDCIGHFPSTPQGDGIATARRLVKKYEGAIKAI